MIQSKKSLPRSGTIFPLEGLRGFCALSVLVSHIGYDSTGYRSGGTDFFPGYVYSFFANFGNIGVLLFFVLSGYVIGLTTSSIPFSAAAARVYAIRRFIRLYPIYFVVIVVSFIIADYNIFSFSFLMHALFMQTWVVPSISSNGVLWTLHLEVMFYTMYLLIWAGTIPLRVAIAICAGCCIFAPYVSFHIVHVLAYFFLWLLGLWASKLDRNDLASAAPSMFWSAVFLAIGFTHINAFDVLVAKTQLFPPPGAQPLPSILVYSGLLLYVVCVGAGVSSTKVRTLALLSAAGAAAGITVIAVYGAYRGIFLSMPSYVLSVFFLFLAAVAAVALRRAPLGFLTACSGLGAISYAVYLVQNPITRVVFYQISPAASELVWWGVKAVVVAAVFLIAYLLELHFQPAAKAVLQFRVAWKASQNTPSNKN